MTESVFHELTGEYVPGDWLLINYGGGLKSFYVIKKSGGQTYLMGHPKICVTDSLYVSLDSYDVEYLGHTKRKWFWRYLPFPLKNLTCPFWSIGYKKKTPVDYVLELP